MDCWKWLIFQILAGVPCNLNCPGSFYFCCSLIFIGSRGPAQRVPQLILVSWVVWDSSVVVVVVDELFCYLLVVVVVVDELFCLWHLACAASPSLIDPSLSTFENICTAPTTSSSGPRLLSPRARESEDPVPQRQPDLPAQNLGRRCRCARLTVLSLKRTESYA